MEDIIKRLKNSYDTGGVREISRKLLFKGIYKYHGRKIYKEVLNAKMEYGLCRKSERDYQVVVSLTTFPKRFLHIELCLKSLILQSEKPDRIIVYLGSDANDVELPKSMKQFERYGVEFQHDKKRNLRSHKKYFYAMQEFPDAVVVTADDDVVYPVDWLKSLLDSYKEYPDAVSARRVHLMRKTEQNILMNYNQWFDQYRKMWEPSHALLATGNSGVLYPPCCLDQRAFDEEAIVRLCFEADDIWLKCMAILHGTKVVWVVNNEVDLPEVGGFGKTEMLSNLNVFEGKNDLYLRQVMEKYHITTDMFFEQ